MKNNRLLPTATLIFTCTVSADPLEWANVNQGDWRFGNGFSFDYNDYAARSSTSAYSLSTSLNYFISDLREIGAGFNFEKTTNGDKPVSMALYLSQHWVREGKATLSATPFVRLGLSDDAYKGAVGGIGEYNYFIDASTAFGPYVEVSHVWSHRSSYNRNRVIVGLAFNRYFTMKSNGK